MTRTQLLDELKQHVTHNIAKAQLLLATPTEQLTRQPAVKAWNVLQIIEHLNTYNNYYLPQIKAKVLHGARSSAGAYKAGMLGNYFVKMMKPVNGAIANKYKAAKKHLPQPSGDISAIENYIVGQQELLQCLQESSALDMQKNKVPVSISPIIKLRLGDVFRFLVAHQQRHFIQINAALQHV